MSEMTALSSVCKVIYRYPQFYGMDKFETGIPVLRGEHLLKNKRISDDWSDFWFVDEAFSKKFPKTVLEDGDVVMSVRGSVGKIGLVEQQHVGAQISPNLIRISPNSEIVDKKFAFFAIDWATEHFVSRNSQAQALPSLSASDIKNMEIFCPPLAEQERIVEILSDADAAIATAETSHLTKHRQIAAISRASQKAGGEKYQLGTLFEFLNGLSGKTANDFGEGHPFVTYMGVFDGPLVKDNAYGLVQASSNEGQTVLKSGDILMTMTSETKPEAGFVSLFENAHQGEVFLNSFCACLRPKANKVIPEFAYCALSSPDFRRQIWRISQGSTRINLSKTEVKKLLLNIPCEEVQLGFAGSLRTTVEEIEKSKRLLTALKKQKRGLMQQLLTGKLRVPEKG